MKTATVTTRREHPLAAPDLTPSTGASTAKFRLGKKRAVFDSRTLRFGAYLSSKLPAPPANADYGKHVKEWPMYLNDKYGDCTCAAAAHMIECWTTAAGHPTEPTDADVLTFYEHFTTPGPDNGCDMLSVLKYWRTGGLGRDKIGAFASLEPRNTTEVMDAVEIFGGCYIGVSLPDFAVASSNLLTIPWVVPPQGPVGNAAPNPDNGHCIPAVAYDQRNLYIVTWGAIKSMSWQFYSAYADESYAIISTDFLTGKKKAPSGFDMAQLSRDLEEINHVPASRAAFGTKKF